MKKYGKRLRELRDAWGLTQVSMGLALDKTANVISKLERDKTLLQSKDITLICRRFNIPRADFISPERYIQMELWA